MPIVNKEAIEKWQQHCADVSALTTSLVARVKETPTDKAKRIKRLQENYAEFCEYYFPHFIQLRNKVTGQVERVVHNAKFHNDAAKKVKETTNLKAVFMWPRGHANSTHFDIFIPLLLMFQPQRLLTKHI